VEYRDEGKERWVDFRLFGKGVFGRRGVRALKVGFAAVLVAVVAGCGAGGGGGQEGEPLKIGVILPYSGVYAQLGEDITDAMELYFEERNNEVAGRPVELITEDTEADPQVGVQAARTLIEREEVDVLAGAVSTAVAYGVIDLTQRDNIPFVIANATGNDATRQGAQNVFRVSASSWQVSYPMGEYLVDEGVESVLLSSADYAAGQEMSAGFREGFEAAGGEIVDEVFPPLGTNDYSSYLTRIRQADPPAVFSFYAGSDAVRFVQQYREFGIEAQLYGPGYIVDEDTLPAQGEAALGVRTALHYSPDVDNPQNEEFKSAFREAYDREPTVYAVQGWDAGWLIGEAVEATEGATEDPDALIEAMENVEFESPRGPMELDENHNPVQNIYIREVQEVEGGEIDNVVIDTIENVQDPGE
jgi:branched-chain amino acid transport system substrate-binding protein